MATDGDLFARCRTRGLCADGALLIARPSGLTAIVGAQRVWTAPAIARPAFPPSGLYRARAEASALILRGIDRPSDAARFEPVPGAPAWPLGPALPSELTAIVEQADLASHADEEG